jgi:hypothetical protein
VPPLEDQAVVPAKWSEAGPKVLDSLGDWTHSDCVILRVEATDAQNLILDGYKFAEHVESSEQYEVPRRKWLGFWNGDAFNSCAVQHHPQGTLDSHRSHLPEGQTPEIERFLSRVIWRGSFPLSLRELGQRIAILVSFDAEPPGWRSPDEIALAWLAGQLAVARHLLDNDSRLESDPFVQASRHILALSCFDSYENRLAALLRVLCSGRGLGWQRVWLMKSVNGQFECETCCGGLTLAEWGVAAAYAEANFGDLLHEIAHDVVDQPRTHDGLYRSCVLDNRLTAPQEWFDSSEKWSRSESLFFVPTEEFHSVHQWKSALQAIGGSQQTRIENDERFFACPINIGVDNYLVVLAWSDTRTKRVQPKVIETGVILALASQFLAAEPPANFAGRLAHLLSWQGIPPLDPVDLERAKARCVHTRYEQSHEVRAAIEQEMLAAAARREQGRSPPKHPK